MNLKEALFIENQLSPEPTRDQLEEALEVLSEHVRDTMWKPADTAPMHERVLVASRCGSTVIAARTDLGWVVEESVLMSIEVSFKITHWMPLPALMEVTE